MIPGEALAERLIAAAKQGDWVAVHAVLDWRVGRARAFTLALGDLDAAEREAMAQRGIADLAATEARAEDAMGALGTLILQLSYPSRIRGATDEERARALAELEVPPAPAHLSAQTEAHITGLRDQAAAIRDVLVIEMDGPKPSRLLFAVTSDAQRLVLLATERR